MSQSPQSPQFNNIQSTEPLEQNQPPEPDYYYTNFIGSHLTSGEPASKTIETPAQKISYKEIPLQYNYGTPESPIVDHCYFECPPVTSRGGIQVKREDKPGKNPGEKYVKESYSMMFTFNLQDSECVKCLDKWDELHSAACQSLARHKGKIGMFSFNPEHPGEAFKHPIYYKIDPNTCERVVGRNPVLWVKLNHWKNNRTLFTDLNENPVDWKLLEDVEVKMVPLIHIEKIYASGNGKASLQIKLASAVITDIAQINTRTRQTRTIDRLRHQKGLADTVASQLAQLRMEKQDDLDTGSYQPQNARIPNNDQDGTMHQIPSSNGNIHGDQESLNDYLGGAPANNEQFNPPQQSTSSGSLHSQSATNQQSQPVRLSVGSTSGQVMSNLQPSTGVNFATSQGPAQTLQIN